MKKLNEIINESMEYILFGETEELKNLRLQYLHSSIKSVEKNDVGCFVEYKVSNDTTIKMKNCYIGDVFLYCEHLESPIGIILFIENGFINTLEFYTYGDDIMPDEYENYRFSYGNDNVRDYSSYIS